MGWRRRRGVFFDVSHLQHLARSGRWAELTSYVNRFLPWYGPPPSPQASTLFGCLHAYRMLGKIAAGGQHAEEVRTTYPLLDAAAAVANPRTVFLHAFFHQVLQGPPRDFAFWMRTWELAAERLKALALACPELKAKMHLPRCAPKSWQINLSGVRPAPRPYIKKANKQKACDIACLIEEKRQKIMGSFSAFSSNGTSDSMRYDMQVLPPVVQTAAGGDAAVGSGAVLGRADEEDASKREEKKRKMMTQDDAEDATTSTRSLKAARKY